METNAPRYSSNLPALQPRTNNQIMALMLTIYREHLVTLLIFSLVINGIAAVFLLPAQLDYQRKLLTTLSNPILRDTESIIRNQVAQASAQLTLFAIQGVVSYIQTVPFATLCVYITSEWLFNRKVSMGEALRESRRGMRNFAVGLLLYMLLMLALFVIFGIGAILIFPLALLVGAVLYAALTLYYFLAPIYTLENIKAVDGIVRTWQLGKVNFWSNFGLSLILALVVVIMAIVFGAIFDGLTAQQVTLANWESYFTAGFIIGTLISIVLAPLLPIAMTIKYFDTRLRYEGLDIALNAVEKENPRLHDVSSAVPAQRIVNQVDLRNMLIITGMLFALVFLLVATTPVSF